VSARDTQLLLGPAQATQQARESFSAGNFLRAEHLCRAFLHAQPNDYEALSLLGIITAQTGRAAESVGLLRRASEVRPDDPVAHSNYGNALRVLQRPAEALAAYERALSLKSAYADAHYNRGTVLRDLKRDEEAVKAFGRALRCNPQHLAAYNNRGNALRDLGRLEEALQDYDQALRLQPEYAKAHANRGNVLRDLKRYDHALASYARALQLNPAYAEGYNNQGVALRACNRPLEALASYERALALEPDYAEAHYNRGNVLQDLKRFAEALASYERGLQLKPEDAGALVNRANALQELGCAAEAAQGYERAQHFSAQLPWLAGSLYFARMKVCAWDGFEAQVAALIAAVVRGEPAATPFPTLILADRPDVQRAAAQRWVAENPAQAPLLSPPGKRAPRGRIRLGYYSADFYNHATAYLAAELFERHDRNRFELVAFAFGPSPGDEMQQRLMAAFDEFHDVRVRSDREVAALSRELGIDIAVDLKGYTRDARSGIFAQRAAAIQVSWLGYPGTMGAPFIDYLVADPTLIPPQSRHYYAEKIVYLPHTYQVNDRRRRIAERSFTREELGLPPEGFVFCCFNNTYKITPAVFDLWMSLLCWAPGSVLWLLEDNPNAADNLRREAEARGVDPTRLAFAPRWPLADHLARQRAAGLFLDTFPCNAHTTASDALWAGLPVLTRMGESFASRVAASLLNAVGLPELVTRSREQYEELALELATFPERLTTIRERLQRNRLTAPLFDCTLFTRHLEEAYIAMYERSQAGLPPDSISVTA
jgi:predicted O-linked N-acetylglucosamine transferase (SPINDLY family)